MIQHDLKRPYLATMIEQINVKTIRYSFLVLDEFDYSKKYIKNNN